ncbi:hypothetical protein ACA910_009938 [Epithemia clementina (nom. ined.)]
MVSVVTAADDPLVEAQIQQLLVEAGLESAPFDPASFEALKRHVRESTEAGKPLFISPLPPAPLSSSFVAAAEEQTSVPDIIDEPPLQSVDIYGPTTTMTTTTATPTTEAVTAPCNDNDNNTSSSSSSSPPPPKTTKTTTSNASPIASNSNNLAPPRLPSSRQALFSPTASDMTDPGSSSFRMNFNSAASSTSSNILISSNNNKASKSIEARILEQLQVQTTLILQLQRRVDELTVTVREQQEQIHSSFRGGTTNNQYHSTTKRGNDDDSSSTTGPGKSATLAAAAPPHAVSDNSNTQPRPAETGAPAPQELRVVAPVPPRRRGGWLFQLVQRPLENVRNSKVAGLWKVFHKVRKQEVRDLQWGVIIKVLVMMFILLGRVMSSSGRNNNSAKESDEFYNIPYKFYVLIAVVIMGMMGQTGYFTFLYKFFVKERYPARILVLGEDVDAILEGLENQGRPRPPPAGPRRDAAGADPGNADGAGAAGGAPEGEINWAQTFLLGGRIARANNNNNNPLQQQQQDNPLEQQQQQGGIGRAIWNAIADVLYLLGSFVLSIFPMWRPQAAQPPQAVAQEQQPVAAAAAAAAEQEGGGNNNNNNENNNNGPGQVRPPRDPAAANEDDDY